MSSASGGDIGTPDAGAPPVAGDVAEIRVPSLSEWSGKDSSLTEVKSLDDVRAIVIANDQKGIETFVRFSKGPEADIKGGLRSKDYASGETHAGLSTNNLSVRPENRDIYQTGGKNYTASQLSEYGYMQMQGGGGTRAYLLTGRVVGKDSDGAPLVRDIKPVAFVSKEAITEAHTHTMNGNRIREERDRARSRFGIASPEYKRLSQEYDGYAWERAGAAVPRVVPQ